MVRFKNFSFYSREIRFGIRMMDFDQVYIKSAFSILILYHVGIPMIIPHWGII